MICLSNQRPALQIGRHQVLEYDTAWLDSALERAATAADQQDFPFLPEIRSGIIQYLESNCPLRLLRLGDLFERVRKMLVTIGCERIAEHLRPLAPPLTVSLVSAAKQAGNGFELAFFESLRADLDDLRHAGAEEIRFTGLRECAQILRGADEWDKGCEAVLAEIEIFLKSWDREDPCSGNL